MFRNQSKTLWLAILALTAAAHASAGEGGTLITDPDLLERLGFPRDSRNVYLAEGAVLNQKSSPAEPEDFGIVDFGYTTVLGTQHQAHSSTEFGWDTYGSVYHISGSGVYVAQVHIPSGALLRLVTFFVRDDATSSTLQGVVYRVCQTGFPIVGPPVATILGSAYSVDGEETFFTVIVPAGEVVRNFACAYFMQTTFYGGTTGDLALRKVRAAWQRQVSPAPAVATFPNDTPTTHPYFPFIEALAAAGITGGCAPGSYCPNNPITRGEMAVFLSVALGLHFIN